MTNPTNPPICRRSIHPGDAGHVGRTKPRRETMVRKAVEHVTDHPGCGWRDVGARWGWAQGTAIRVARLALHEGLLAGDLEALRLPATHPDDCRCEACWAEGAPLPVGEGEVVPW